MGAISVNGSSSCCECSFPAVRSLFFFFFFLQMARSTAARRRPAETAIRCRNPLSVFRLQPQTIRLPLHDLGRTTCLWAPRTPQPTHST